MTDDAPTQPLPAATEPSPQTAPPAGTSGATGATDPTPAAATGAVATTDSDDVPVVNVTRLTHEALSRSGLLWVRVPGGDSHPVWHVWHDDGDERGTGPAAYVVSGPGQQSLPWLPDEVELVRAARTPVAGCSPCTRPSRARAEDDGWDAAVEVLRPERLNAVGDVAQRWAQSCTIHVLTPHGRPAEQPGSYSDGSGAAPVRPSAGTTARWRPWHWRGRADARRNTRS